MRFHSYDSLRVFEVVARTESFTLAAEELNLTKGAISYRIRSLETDLGFPVFTRGHRSIALTEKGARLLDLSRAAFGSLDDGIAALREREDGELTVATSTYFASRWLAPRLMTFIAAHPTIDLRLLPLVDLMDLRRDRIDIAIRWGKDDWTDVPSEPFFRCPAFPTASAVLAAGDDAFSAPLLHDREGSVAWADWHAAAGLEYTPARDHLVIPDPNVRVEAVAAGQGIALNDSLVDDDLSQGRLVRVSRIALDDYGYHLAYPKGVQSESGFTAFRDWIKAEAPAYAIP